MAGAPAGPLLSLPGPVATAWLLVAAIVLAFTLMGLVAAFVVDRYLVALAARTRMKLDDILVDAIRGAVRFVGFLVGLHVALEVAPPLPPRVDLLARRALAIGNILVIALMAIRLVRGVFVHYGGRNAAFRGVAPFLQRVSVSTIVVVAALYGVQVFGISLTPFLTAFGIAGIVLGLALQDTLGNLFAGLYLTADRPIGPGQYVQVKLPDVLVEGYVLGIGWRSTRIRDLGDRIVVIPNARLAGSVLTNFEPPGRPMTLAVPVTVASTADPGQVADALVAEAHAARADLPGLLADPAPRALAVTAVHPGTFAFTLICHAEPWLDQHAAQHALRLRIVRRLQGMGVEVR